VAVSWTQAGRPGCPGDLPPLMWHAELGRSLLDLWSGTHQRGAQLHDLREAVLVWATRYGH